MANETNFAFDEAVVYREAAEDTIPATPIALKVAGLINYTVKDTQKTETTTNLSAGGQSSRKDRGTSDFAGNIENKMMGDIMPFIITHVMGAATTKANATAAVWVAATAYAAFDPYALTGDMFNHTDGVHTLVCKIAGTSDATAEPVLTGLVSGDTVVDGTVTWIVRGLMKSYIGQTEPCLPTFGTEYSSTSGCDGGASTFIKRFGGSYLNSFEIAKASGTIIHKYSLPIVSMSGTDNVVDAAFTSIKSEVGYTEVSMNELPFGYDDVKIQFDTLALVNARSFRMTINRNTAVADSVEKGKKISNTPQMTVDGEISLKFTKEEYLAAYNNKASVVKAMFGKINGDIAHFTFNYVERDRVDPDFSTSEPAYLTIPLTASGDKTTPSINYTVYSEVDY